MSLYSLEWDVWNADESLDNNELIQFIRSELPYLKQCKGQIHVEAIPTQLSRVAY